MDAVAGGELFGSEPVMVVGRHGIVHRVDVFLEVGLGLRVAFEEDEDVIEAKVVGDGAAVIFLEGSGGGGVAGERDEFGFVDGFGDLGTRGLGAEGRGRGEGEQGDKDGATAHATASRAGKNFDAPWCGARTFDSMAEKVFSRRGALTVG